jgi:Skp family chaperone for outer membrane proteins
MRILLATLISLAAVPALAHDFAAEIARFNQIAATRDLTSQQAVQARILSERAQAELDQAETRLLLRVRSLTNQALREAGQQPAFLTSEIARLEAALAQNAAAAQRLAPLLAEIRLTKAAYDALDRSSSERMREALAMIEAAPTRR